MINSLNYKDHVNKIIDFAVSEQKIDQHIGGYLKTFAHYKKVNPYWKITLIGLAVLAVPKVLKLIKDSRDQSEVEGHYEGVDLHKPSELQLEKARAANEGMVFTQ